MNTLSLNENYREIPKVLGLGDIDSNGNYEVKLMDYDNSPGSNCWIMVTTLWDDSCKDGYQGLEEIRQHQIQLQHSLFDFN